MEGCCDPDHGLCRVSVRGAQFLPREDAAEPAQMGAAPRGARARSAGRLASASAGRRRCGAQGDARDVARRRAPRAARSPSRLYRRHRDPRQQRRGSARRGRRYPAGADQAARALATDRRPVERHRPAHPRGQRCRRRPLPPGRDPGGHRRAHQQGGRPVDPDRRAPRQRARNGGADDPASRLEPHPGAGPGPAGSDPSEGDSREDGQAGVPHGRRVDAPRAGVAEPSTGGVGDPLRCQESVEFHT